MGLSDHGINVRFLENVDVFNDGFCSLNGTPIA